MNRVTAVLMLVMAGLLTTSLTLVPSAALAADPVEQFLEVPDTRDDVIADYLGSRPGGTIPPPPGDPDAMGGGFGMDDSDTLDDLLEGLGAMPDGVTTEDLLIYLMMSIWATP